MITHNVNDAGAYAHLANERGCTKRPTTLREDWPWRCSLPKPH